MNRLLIATAFFLSVFLVTKHGVASHVAGADITYQCVGQDSFLTKVNVFRDCDGINWTSSTINVSLSSPCGGSFTATLNPVAANLGPNNNLVPQEVSQVCNLSQSQCNGGNLPGMELFTYEGIVVLNPPCNTWEIEYSPPCCRNSQQIVNLQTSSSGTYVFSTLNSQNDSCNNSPAFATDFPNPHYCVGQSVCHDFGVTETDGDSLVYSLVSAYTAPGTQANYVNPYTGAQPIQGITMDPATGKVQFSPVAAGFFVVVVEVCEYDRQTGALLGCVRRDMQFGIDNCSNQPSGFCSTDTIANLQGVATKTGPRTIEICNGNSFSFDVVISDPDITDTLTATSDIGQLLPGANFSMTPSNGGNPLTVTFSGTASPQWGDHNSFKLNVSDNHCPIPYISSARFNIDRISATYIQGPSSICHGDSAQLRAIGGSVFNWTVIQGDQNSLGCMFCAQPTVFPSVTTTYQVSSNLASSCKAVDTATVIVAPDFNVQVTNDTTICSVSPIQLSATPSLPGQSYNYQWNNTHYLDQADVADPVANPDSATKFTVSVTSDTGCTKAASVNINLSPPFPRNNMILASDTIICIDDTINLNAELGEVTSANCGTSSNTCVGNTNTQQVGNGTNTNNANSFFGGSDGFPTPFAGENNSARQQYLYRASDIYAADMGGGKITAISFFIVSNNGPLVYNDYEVKMGCTDKSELTTNWETGLTVVRNANPIFPSSSGGWYTITLDNPYAWDGQSNLVVEICFNNPASSENVVTSYTNKSYHAASFIGAGGPACGSSMQDSQSPVQKLPNIRFEVCSELDTSVITYNWINAPNLVNNSSATDRSIEAWLDSATSKTYTLVISDTFGYCSDTVSQQVHVVEKYNVTPVADQLCTNSGIVQLNAFTPVNLKGVNAIWSGTGVVNDTLGLFDPSVAGLGQHNVTYSVGGDSCANSASNFVTVMSPPDPAITTLGPFCEVDSNVVISGVTPGYVTGVDPEDQAAVVDSANGILDLRLLNASDLRINWTAVTQHCKNDSMYVIPLTPQFKAKPLDPGGVCPHDSVIQLLDPDHLTLDQPNFHGTWSGQGIVDNKMGLFDPSAYAPGSMAKVVLDSNGICGNRDSIFIKIDTLPDIGFQFLQGGHGPYCKGDNQNVVFEGFPLDDPFAIGSGQWNHLNGWLQSPVTAFNPANNLPSAGRHNSVYTFTDLNGCVNSDTLEVVIYPSQINPVLSFDQASSEISTQSYLGNYHWFFNGSPIAQVPLSDSVILASQSGHYQVEVTNMCATGRSDSLLVILSTVPESRKLKGKKVLVYPNPIPVGEPVKIDNSGEAVLKVELIDVTGQVHAVKWIGGNGIIPVETGELPKGQYYFRVLTKTGAYSIPVAVQ